MEITIEYSGIRFTLYVCSDDDGDYFEIKKLECFNEVFECVDLANLLIEGEVEINRRAHAELAIQRHMNNVELQIAREC